MAREIAMKASLDEEGTLVLDVDSLDLSEIEDIRLRNAKTGETASFVSEW